MHLDNLVLNKSDKKTLENLVASELQSLLIVADSGFGKETVARVLADMISGGKAENQLYISAANESSITIEQARQLKKFFMLRTNSTKDFLVGCIVDADLMTIESQNAVLKLLEEPPAHTKLIMTSSKPGILLPTILSRLHRFNLREPLANDLREYFLSNHLDVSALKIAPRLPGLAVAIAKGEKSGLTDSIAVAKSILSMDTFERLRLIDKYTKNKSDAYLLLEALKIISVATLNSLVTSGSKVGKWHSISNNVLRAQKYLSQNASTKLVLTDIVLSL